jgi:hypothetical protein
MGNDRGPSGNPTRYPGTNRLLGFGFRHVTGGLQKLSNQSSPPKFANLMASTY